MHTLDMPASPPIAPLLSPLIAHFRILLITDDIDQTISATLNSAFTFLAAAPFTSRDQYNKMPSKTISALKPRSRRQIDSLSAIDDVSKN
jgi:hypothetical protein